MTRATSPISGAGIRQEANHDCLLLIGRAAAGPSPIVRPCPSRGGYRSTCFVLAVVLLAASALKCWELATGPAIATGMLDSRWVRMAVVEFELFFGIWLLANTWARPTWAAALVCFGCFACVSLGDALSGHATCGCFGRVPVNPWYAGALDVAVLALLLRRRPKQTAFAIHRAIGVSVIWLAIGFPAAFAMTNNTNTTLSDTGVIFGDGRQVLLEPEKWIGKNLPLLGYIDVGDKLREGTWLVLLYHHDCVRCREVIGNLQRFTREFSVQRVALIEMAPYAPLGNMQIPEGKTIVCGRLTDAVDWFADTPIVMMLQREKVVTAGVQWPFR